MLICTLLVPVAVSAQNPEHVMELSPAQGAPGGTVEVPIVFDNALELAGYYLGVVHQPAELALLDLLDGEITSELDPEFHNWAFYPEGFTLTVAYMQAGMVFLPSGLDQEVHRIVYQVDSSTLKEFTTVSFSENLTDPPIAPSMADFNTGSPIDPLLLIGSDLEIVEGMLRGDTNFDGTIDLADPIHLAMWLFVQGDPVSCVDAADANDDGTVDVSDVVTLLGHLFGSSGGSLPGTCEVDPTVDPLDCTVPNCP